MARVEVLKQVRGCIPRKVVCQAVKAALEVEGKRGRKTGVTVVFVGKDKMRRLCREFRGEDRVADVLSFPSELPDNLGDIIICLPQAKRQAKEVGWVVRKEVALLSIHGTLHLLGHEDETEEGRKRMREREAKALSLLSISPEEGRVV